MSETVIGLCGGSEECRTYIGQYLSQQHGWMMMGLRIPARAALAAMLNMDPQVRFSPPEFREQPVHELGHSFADMERMLVRWARERIHPRMWLLVAGAALDVMRAHAAQQGGRMPHGIVWVDIGSADEADWIRTEQQGTLVHIREPGTDRDVWWQNGDRELEDKADVPDMARKVDAMLPFLPSARRIIVTDAMSLTH